MRKVIIFGIIILLGVGLYFVVNRDQRVESQYYNDLLTQCSTQEDSECCASSVVAMATGDYLLADDSGQCPEGLTVNSLKCPSSLKWCQ